jgi:hypothetical protein
MEIMESGSGGSMANSSTPNQVAKFALCILLPLFFGILLGFKIKEQKSIVDQISRQGRINQIELMLRMYYGDHRAFPPTQFQRNPNEPRHSWRVLLLPYMTPDWQKSFERYDFGKEWDSKINQEAIGLTCPSYFRIDDPPGLATQFLSLGSMELWPSDDSMKAYIVKEGLDSFILIESKESKTKWAKPEY